MSIRRFSDTTEQETFALAIPKEEDGRTYANSVQGLRDTFPDSARIFDGVAVGRTGTAER